MNEKICLLISTWNRGKQLANTLQSLTRLTLPDEILIVDDGSVDNTEQVCKSFEGKLPIRYIYNHNPQMSVCSFAKNIGIKNTDCEIIICSEPEVIFISDIIAQYKQLHEQYPHNVLNAATIYLMNEGVKHDSEMITSPQSYLNKSHVVGWEDREKKHEFIVKLGWTANFTTLYRKEWLMAVNGWDEAFPRPYSMDDVDLNQRLKLKLMVGLYNFEECKVLHQWHIKADIGSNVQPNIDYVLSKGIGDGTSPDHPNLIANKNEEWGKIKYR